MTATATATTTKTIYLLTGDIGGTNSRMHLYDTSSSYAEPLVVRYYLNEEHLKQSNNDSNDNTDNTDGLFVQKIIAPFLQHCWESSASKEKLVDDPAQCEIVACLACAGIVRHNRVTITNIGPHGLVIDGTAIEQQQQQQQSYSNNDNNSNPYLSRIRVCKIINDFVAQGYGCLTLQPKDVRELVPNSHAMIDPTGPKVCVGAGTGLGECYLTPNNNNNNNSSSASSLSSSYTCFPSEGGHVEFAPRSKLQTELWEYVRVKFDYQYRISIERIVSGRGLANVYEFLAKKKPEKVDANVHAQFVTAGDFQGKIVAEHATEKESLCRQAMDIMMSAYGCEVGSAALKFIPTGGMYVTGGLTPKNIHFIEGNDSEFMKAYFDKGRVKPILQSIPLFAVMEEDLGVRGVHHCALEEYQKYIASSKSGDQN